MVHAYLQTIYVDYIMKLCTNCKFGSCPFFLYVRFVFSCFYFFLRYQNSCLQKIPHFLFQRVASTLHLHSVNTHGKNRIKDLDQQSPIRYRTYRNVQNLGFIFNFANKNNLRTLPVRTYKSYSFIHFFHSHLCLNLILFWEFLHTPYFFFKSYFHFNLFYLLYILHKLFHSQDITFCLYSPNISYSICSIAYVLMSVKSQIYSTMIKVYQQFYSVKNSTLPSGTMFSLYGRLPY